MMKWRMCEVMIVMNRYKEKEVEQVVKYNHLRKDRERLLGILEREKDFREQICTFQQLKREKQRAPLIFGWREKRRER